LLDQFFDMRIEIRRLRRSAPAINAKWKIVAISDSCHSRLCLHD
jgi:hypothetical protein